MSELAALTVLTRLASGKVEAAPCVVAVRRAEWWYVVHGGAASGAPRTSGEVAWVGAGFESSGCVAVGDGATCLGSHGVAAGVAGVAGVRRRVRRWGWSAQCRPFRHHHSHTPSYSPPPPICRGGHSAPPPFAHPPYVRRGVLAEEVFEEGEAEEDEHDDDEERGHQVLLCGWCAGDRDGVLPCTRETANHDLAG